MSTATETAASEAHVKLLEAELAATRLRAVADDAARLRLLETDVAVHTQKIDDHGRIITAIDAHLADLSAQFQAHRESVQAAFSKLEIRALVALLLFFASSSNAQRIAQFIGLG